LYSLKKPVYLRLFHWEEYLLSFSIMPALTGMSMERSLPGALALQLANFNAHHPHSLSI